MTTANEIFRTLKQLQNSERNTLLEMLYYEYFDNGITAQQRAEMNRVWEAYEDGLLIEKEGY